MSVAIISGSAGLIGGESARLFAGEGFEVIGIDNDMRSEFFGSDAATAWNRRELEADLKNYKHYELDIRDREGLKKIFTKFGKNISIIIHTAAQPSHEWAAKDPVTDFTVNANGTLNLLELARHHCEDAVFIFTSTNKVYGDTPNSLPLRELETRWELPADGHPYGAHGIDEQMNIDHCTHSVFGASKVAADVLVQEYGRYFGMKTACFRCGCLTGSAHSGVQLHGFLAYLMKCVISKSQYKIFGYKGKQVRDNIHAGDLVGCFRHFYLMPLAGGQVYNIGGSRYSNCSVLEAITMCNEISGVELNWSYEERNRVGDHMWWISDIRRFRAHYPEWELKYDIRGILEELYEGLRLRHL